MSLTSIEATKIIVKKLVIPRMNYKNIDINHLAKMVKSDSSLIEDWLNLQCDISLYLFIDILTILEINPQFIFKEDDSNDYHHIHFN